MREKYSHSDGVPSTVYHCHARSIYTDMYTLMATRTVAPSTHTALHFRRRHSRSPAGLEPATALSTQSAPAAAPEGHGGPGEGDPPGRM